MSSAPGPDVVGHGRPGLGKPWVASPVAGSAEARLHRSEPQRAPREQTLGPSGPGAAFHRGCEAMHKDVTEQCWTPSWRRSGRPRWPPPPGASPFHTLGPECASSLENTKSSDDRAASLPHRPSSRGRRPECLPPQVTAAEPSTSPGVWSRPCQPRVSHVPSVLSPLEPPDVPRSAVLCCPRLAAPPEPPGT